MTEEWKPPEPKLGTRQANILASIGVGRFVQDSKATRGEWFYGCGWTWDSALFTVKTLQALARKGLVDVVVPTEPNARGGWGWGHYRINDAGQKWLADSITPEQHAANARAEAKSEVRRQHQHAQWDIHTAQSAITKVAIDVVHQRATFDDLASAVDHYERLVQEHEDLTAQHGREGLL